MAGEKRNPSEGERVLLLNKGKRGLGRLIFGRTGVILLLLAVQCLMLLDGFVWLG